MDYGSAAKGAAVGAIALFALGFSPWGNWHFGSTAVKLKNEAVAKVLVRQCADDILANEKTMADLKGKSSSWQWGDIVKEAWKPKNLPAGIDIPTDWSFPRDCAREIEARQTKAAQKT